MIDDVFVRNADIEKLNDFIMNLCSEGDAIANDIEYYKRRYKPEACKDKIKELNQKLYSNTSLLILLTDLKDNIKSVKISEKSENNSIESIEII